MTNSQLESLAEAIVQTRDMVGNERQAVKDWCAENGVPFTEELNKAAMELANAQWHASQVAAGSKKLTPAERADAMRSLK